MRSRMLPGAERALTVSADEVDDVLASVTSESDWQTLYRSVVAGVKSSPRTAYPE
jgi:hypothetical protein